MSYTFDGVGNVDLYKNDAYLHITEQDYSYDALYQLTGVNATSTAKILAPRYDASYSQTFDFDDNGNIETKTSTSQCNMQASRVNDLNYEIESVYDEAYAHRVVNSGDVYYQYDANGNITLEHQGLIPEEGPQEMRTVEQFDNAYGTDYGFAIVEKPAGGTYCGTSYREFTWNERNLMRTSRDSRYRVDYRYGADGQRAIKQSSKSETLYYNSMWQLKSNYGPKMRQSKHIYVGETRFVTKCSIRGDDDNVSYESQNIYYYHADHLGSTELVTNVDGLIYERIEYTPYGELWIEEKGSEPTPFRFTGKELDEETGLYYYGARYLDPKYSRWLSADPALGEYIPGAPVNEEARKRNSNLPGMGGVFNTINLHLYHYAGNNPVKYIDPDGRKAGMPSDVERHLENRKKNQEFAAIVRTAVGADYSHRRPPTKNKMDCSGLIVYALKKMGFKIPDNLTAKELASGKLPWILLSDTDNSEQGEPGVLNFYKFGNTTVVHVNVGVGKIGNEEENQVVDASASGTQWQGARNRAPGNRQSPNAQAGKVNKKWAPFSTNHTPDVQARIQWENLKEAEE